MQVTYSQKWSVPFTQSETWQFFSRCFVDSDSVSEWPHFISSLKCDSHELIQGTTIHATYRLGPLQNQAKYILKEIIPQNKIVYHTDESHALIGQSEIHLKNKGHWTEIHWFGNYQNRHLPQIALLVWFKALFEPLFFSRLRIEMRKSESLVSDKE